MGKRQVLSAVIVVLLVNIACGGSQPLQTTPSPAKPTTPPPTKHAGGQATGSDQSESDGQVRFQDPISNNILTVTLKDEQTSQPVEKIETWFVSNGTQVLVITHDPSNRYADTIREFRYSELSLQDSSGAKLAAPVQQLSLAAVILLVKIVDLYQDFTKWKAFFQDFPDIEKWSKETVQLCVTPDQASKGLGLASDLLIGFVTKGMFGDQEIEVAFEEIFNEFGEEGTGTILDRYASTQTPSIMRFTVFSIKDGFPAFLRIDGFCLEPLNRQEPQSALRWLLYGIQEQEFYPFQNLAVSEFYGYANYIEGGDPVSREKFLLDLEPRLESSHVACDGYEASDDVIRVWTKGWSPAWKMTQICYVDCNVLDPAYQSSVAGFFLYKSDDEWTLRVNYLNEPQNYYFGSYDLISCDQPERLAINSSQLPDEPVEQSCPGAPPQRMSPTEKGYVCTQDDNVYLRSEPSRSGNILAGLPPGTLFTVIDGPRCADDWSWWRVSTDQGLDGWVSEGGDNVDPYFICPLE